MKKDKSAILSNIVVFSTVAARLQRVFGVCRTAHLDIGDADATTLQDKKNTD
jgi:hypothetical protein